RGAPTRLYKFLMSLLAFHLARKVVRLPCRSRDTYFIRYGQRPANRRFERNPMPLGNINWLYARTRAERRSNCFSGPLFVDQCSPAACRVRQLFVRSDQNALGAADGRPIYQDAQVGCETHSTWMRVALSVAKKQIWQRFQFSQRSQ